MEKDIITTTAPTTTEGQTTQDDSGGATTEEDDSCHFGADEQTSGGSFDVEFWLPITIVGPVLHQTKRVLQER